MLEVEENLLLLSIVADQRVERVAVRHPADQSRVRRQRDDRVPLNSNQTAQQTD